MKGVSYCDLIWNTNKDREKTVVFDRAISGKYITLDHAEMFYGITIMYRIIRKITISLQTMEVGLVS